MWAPSLAVHESTGRGLMDRRGTLRVRRGAAHEKVRRDATATNASFQEHNHDNEKDTLLPNHVSIEKPTLPNKTDRPRFFHTLSRVYSLARPYFFSDQRWRARVLLAIVVTLCGLTTWLMVIFSYCQRDMSTALSEKDVDSFYKAVWRYVFIIAIAAPLFSFYGHAQSLLALEWRVWLTGSLLEQYFADDVFFKIKMGEVRERGEVMSDDDKLRKDELRNDSNSSSTSNPPSRYNTLDNPEQRICEDIQFFTDVCASLLTSMVTKISSAVAFFHVLYVISPKLILVCFFYSAGGTFLTARLFAHTITKLHMRCATVEANLRTLLLRIRDHAESIAFGMGGGFEFTHAKKTLNEIKQTIERKLDLSKNIALTTNVLEFATFAVPSVVVAPMYFTGAIQFGVVTQAGYAFRQVQGCLNFIVSRFEELTRLASTTERLETLMCSFQECKTCKPVRHVKETATDTVTDQPLHILSVSNVSVSVPGGSKPLWKSFSLSLEKGDSVLLTGPSGCGKSAAFRVLAGLWEADCAGDTPISLPDRSGIVFLPQASYLPTGVSLFELVTYPSVANDAGGSYSDSDVLNALLAVGFESLPSGYEKNGLHREDVEWSELLSHGERQRLNFARVVLRKPILLFLDEATSALDEESEGTMYQLCLEHAGAVLSIGHRSSLLRYHEKVMKFRLDDEGCGTWDEVIRKSNKSYHK